MRTNQKTPRHPEELWQYTDIDPIELVLLDPLNITDEMVELAEHPELENPVIRALPDPGER